MKIVVHKQGSPEWLAWRQGGLGSSDAAVIAAHHGMCEKATWTRSLNALYEEKITGVSKVVENVVMRRGTNGESGARASYEALTGMALMPLCGEMDENPMIRASFDGFPLDGRTFVEIKCPSASVHALAKQGVIVGYYVPQVVHQALVAWGLPQGWPDDAAIRFYSFVPETGDGASVIVPAATYCEYAQQLYEYELDFLEMVKNATPPCGEEFLAAAARYLALDRQIKALEKARDLYKDELIEVARARDAKTIQGAGVTLLKAERAGSVDWARMAAEYNISGDEQERYRKKGSAFWQVRTAKLAASKDDAATA